MIRVDIAKSLRRKRMIGIGIVLAFLGVLPVLVALASGSHGGPPFFQFIHIDGLFAPLTALAISQPFFLPLMAGMLAGDSVAGDAANGMLRVLLVRPVPRARLLAAKIVSTFTQVGIFVFVVVIVAMIIGLSVYGAHGMPTLSGGSISIPAALIRIALAAAYVVAGLIGLSSIGIFLSTLTDSGPGATVVTVGYAIVAQILDSLDAIRWIRPYLLNHRWFAFVDLFRSPVEWGAMANGLMVFSIYTAIFLGAAFWWFTRKDIQS